ncbi:MAG: leucine-rich repeat protein [Bacilli bacterium]|nr:leucine-rich repeat protein [Bacilli bacterium]
MRDRKKRNTIIGVLCCLLVVMGIGYAILSQTLNISGIANMKGVWDVKITNIQLVATTGTARGEESSFTDTTATFKGYMYMPGDSAEYKITVTNAGNLDAKLENVTQSVENEVNDIKFTNTAVKDRILKAGDTYEFTVKAVFDESAVSIPDKGTALNYTITLQYVQYDRNKVYNVSTNPTKEDCFSISNDGVITAYDYTCGTNVVIPNEINNVVVKSISGTAFEITDYGDNNIFLYSTANGDPMYVFENQEVFDMFIYYSFFGGYTKIGYKKYIESSLKEQNKTVDDWLKEQGEEYNQTFSTIDQFIEYSINDFKEQLKEYPDVYVLKENANLSDKTLIELDKIALSDDGLTYDFSSADASSAVSSPITSLDLSKTENLETVDCFNNMPNIKKLNLGVNKVFTYSNYLNEKMGDSSSAILDEVIVTSDVYNEISKSSSNSVLFPRTTITKLVILDGTTTHELKVSNFFEKDSTIVKEISLEDGITKLGAKVFENLHLEKIAFPSSITSIESKSLANNTTLTSTGLGKLPKLLSELSPDAFNGDTSLTKITLTSEENINGWESGSQIQVGTNRDTGTPIYATIEYER